MGGGLMVENGKVMIEMEAKNQMKWFLRGDRIHCFIQFSALTKIHLMWDTQRLKKTEMASWQMIQKPIFSWEVPQKKLHLKQQPGNGYTAIDSPFLGNAGTVGCVI